VLSSQLDDVQREFVARLADGYLYAAIWETYGDAKPALGIEHGEDRLFVTYIEREDILDFARGQYLANSDGMFDGATQSGVDGFSHGVNLWHMRQHGDLPGVEPCELALAIEGKGEDYTVSLSGLT
jgi:hypothetical protein